MSLWEIGGSDTCKSQKNSKNGQKQNTIKKPAARKFFWDKNKNKLKIRSWDKKRLWESQNHEKKTNTKLRQKHIFPNLNFSSFLVAIVSLAQLRICCLFKFEITLG